MGLPIRISLFILTGLLVRGRRDAGFDGGVRILIRKRYRCFDW
jgi:hypothetical protein